MASLVRIGCCRLSSRCQLTGVNAWGLRSMSGSPWEGGNPTHSTGGIFKFPSGETPPPQEEISDWVKKNTANHWKSYGYNQFNEKIDRQMHKILMFALFSIGVVVNIAIMAYQPDRFHRDWAIREAYLTLREREAAGVEPLSKDLVDPEKILAALPSDEELKTAGVVINI